MLATLAIVGLVTATFVQAPGRPVNPIGNFLIALEVDGVLVGSFSEVSGLASETEVIEFRDGEDNTVFLPGRTQYGPIILTRAMTGDTSLWEWRQLVIDGNMNEARKTASLVMYDASGKPVAKYFLENAWPSKIEIGALKPGSNELLVETMTLVCENIQRVSP